MYRSGSPSLSISANEALTLIDIGVQASVVAVGVSAPPSDPQRGACWIVGAPGSGAWEGQDQALAGWTGGGWRFIAAREGMMVWSKADGMTARYRSGQWQVGEVTARVGLLSGCVMPLAQAPTMEAAVRVLTHNGCRVVVPPDQLCCGALNLHGGDRDQAQRMARRNIDTFLK